jgi:hypothetical protein
MIAGVVESEHVCTPLMAQAVRDYLPSAEVGIEQVFSGWGYISAKKKKIYN